MEQTRVSLDFDNESEAHAESGREGIRIRCPNCHAMVYATMIISEGTCFECDFEMRLTLVHDDVPSGVPYWERDNE